MQVDGQEIRELQEHIASLELRLSQVESFLNKAFNVSQGAQHRQPNDRNETGMGAIIGADRTSFL